MLVTDVVESSWAAAGEGYEEGEPSPPISLSGTVHAAVNELREYMFRNVYLLAERRAEVERARNIVRFLFRHALEHPDAISSGYSLPEDPLPRRAADFVSGMTDRYAIRLAADLGCADARGWPL